MDAADVARILYQERAESYRLRESLISAIQAIAAVAQAVEEIQDAVSASELRSFVQPETKEWLADANSKLIEALKGLMDEKAQQSSAQQPITWGGQTDGNG
ncbi:MAG TPA: hypothetical protein VEZ26_06130 [Sphingomonadaceae bacterium]|nr:hypothetical protein [Sphingomonadaceae bacterium]